MYSVIIFIMKVIGHLPCGGNSFLCPFYVSASLPCMYMGSAGSAVGMTREPISTALDLNEAEE